MKKQILELIDRLIKEHEENGYCTDHGIAADNLADDVEIGADSYYDVGRYETLMNLYSDIENL